MNTFKSPKDVLRDEYYNDLQPEIIKVIKLFETQVQWYLRDIVLNLEQYERIQIKIRQKDCESAISALNKRYRVEGENLHR